VEPWCADCSKWTALIVLPLNGGSTSGNRPGENRPGLVRPPLLHCGCHVRLPDLSGTGVAEVVATALSERSAEARMAGTVEKATASDLPSGRC
jgi:hypothetical protein